MQQSRKDRKASSLRLWGTKRKYNSQSERLRGKNAGAEVKTLNGAVRETQEKTDFYKGTAPERSGSLLPTYHMAVRERDQGRSKHHQEEIRHREKED